MNSPTGIVFTTYTGNNVVHSWRMNKGTSQEWIGHIFNPSSSGDKTFNIDARSDNLRFLTNEVHRAAIWYRVGNQTINSSSFNQSGYFGLSLNQNFITSSSSTGPFSLFHMVDGSGGTTVGTYAPTLGFRGWMKNGITLTGNSDQMYIGHKYATVDGTQQNGKSQAVVQWSEGTLDGDRQSLRFLFTTTPASGTGAVATDGLEIMRLWPESNTSGYVGIGDFNTAAATPSERLDLLDKTIRLRDFTTSSYQNDTYDRVLVANPSDGRVYWRAASTLGAPGCQWTMGGGATNNVYTAVGTATSGCPDDAEAVGVGVALTSTPTYKFGVATSNFATGASVTSSMVTGTSTGISITASGGTTTTRGLDVVSTQTSGGDNRSVSILANGSGGGGTNYGLRADLSGTSYRTRGMSVSATGGSWTEYAGEFLSYGNASYPCGVYALVDDGVYSSTGVLAIAQSEAIVNAAVSGTATGTSTNSYVGVSGAATSSSTAAYIRGLYGSAPTTAGGYSNSFALEANGDALVAGTAYYLSDEQVKDNIQDITGGLDRVLQLEPKSYTYRASEFPQLGLSGGQHLGLLAQNVEAVLPELVKEMHRPATLDSLGNMAMPAVDVKAVDYNGLISLLIAAVREQNGVINGLQQQLVTVQQESRSTSDLRQEVEDLRSLIAGCCANGALQQGGTGQLSVEGDGSLMGNARALSIQPNPFTDHTTLFYTLERSGRMQLLANSADGKQLRVLTQAQREAGQYQFEWNTTDLSPGVYYLTLLLDEEPVVKKAVRVKE